jgi:hypothetical protein
MVVAASKLRLSCRAGGGGGRLLIVGPALSPSDWHDCHRPGAPGGNGKGNNGNGKGNGGPTGAHEDQGSAAKANKDKKDKSTGDSAADGGDDADRRCDQRIRQRPDTLASPAIARRSCPDRRGARAQRHDFVAGEIVVANMADKTCWPPVDSASSCLMNGDCRL